MFKVPTGYPPANEQLREWLLTLNSDNKMREEPEVTKLLQGFIHSLLCMTLKRLEEIEGSGLSFTPDIRT